MKNFALSLSMDELSMLDAVLISRTHDLYEAKTDYNNTPALQKRLDAQYNLARGLLNKIDHMLFYVKSSD